MSHSGGLLRCREAAHSLPTPQKACHNLMAGTSNLVKQIPHRYQGPILLNKVNSKLIIQVRNHIPLANLLCTSSACFPKCLGQDFTQVHSYSAEGPSNASLLCFMKGNRVYCAILLLDSSKKWLHFIGGWRWSLRIF